MYTSLGHPPGNKIFIRRNTMKKALALLLAVLMLLSSVAMIASAEGDQPAEINLEELYGATYVGAALGADDAKPEQDGVIGTDEYQVERVISAMPDVDAYTGESVRFGDLAVLLGDYKQYVAHDAEWLYVGFDYFCGESESDGTQRGRFYWNLSFIDSFDVQYTGGTSINEAFKQNGYGFAEGWYFGAEVKDTITTDAETGASYWEYSQRNGDNGTVTRGEAPVVNEDFFVQAWKENVTTPTDSEGNTKTHQVYEFKISKAWYAEQVGLASAADVRELAWVTQGEKINLYASSYTQIGHYISDAELATLEATGYTYTRSTSNSQPYDNASLPLLFVLDEEPLEINVEDMPGYTPFYAGAEAIATAPVQDGVINDGEYSASRKLAPLTANKLLSGADPSNYVNFTTEYVAYDADYIYYAYENDSIYASGAQIKIRLEHDYIIGRELTPFACHRQLQDPAAQQINIGLEGVFSTENPPAGKTAPTTDDIVVGHTWAGSYQYAAVEIKISRAYLATQMGLDSAADVTKLTYSTYGQDTKWDGSDWTYLHLDHYLTEDQKAWLTAQGVETSFEADTDATGVTRLCNMIILDEAPPAEINLEDWYGATYVGEALGSDDAKPVQDGVVNLGEYQAEYIVERGDMENIPTDTSRFGEPMLLLGDYSQFVAHDDEWIYVAFAFSNGKENTRGRLYWNLSFIDSFDVTYYGGNTVADAFKQGEYALNDGWNFGAEIKDVITTNEETGDSYWEYSVRNEAVTRGTAPVMGTDFFVTVNKITDIWTAGTNRQVYEFKISKAWYAAQVGLESAADVRELAWVTLGECINTGASSYTQIGHHLSDEDLEMLAATGHSYATNGSGHPYDNASLPLLFVLDADPDAEGEQARVPAERVEPTWAQAAPAPDGGDEPSGDEPSGDEPAGDQPAGDTPAATTEATTTAAATTTAKATTAAETTAATTAAKKGCKGSISISALVLLPTLAGGALLIKRRKED